MLSFIIYPFCLKSVFAPILDTHYISRLGKRKTYIVPLSYTFSLIFFITAFYIHDWILHKNIMNIFAVGFTTVFIVAIQDTALVGL